jgi:hypothetical protein
VQGTDGKRVKRKTLDPGDREWQGLFRGLLRETNAYQVHFGKSLADRSPVPHELLKDLAHFPLGVLGIGHLHRMQHPIKGGVSNRFDLLSIGIQVAMKICCPWWLRTGTIEKSNRGQVWVGVHVHVYTKRKSRQAGDGDP